MQLPFLAACLLVCKLLELSPRYDLYFDSHYCQNCAGLIIREYLTAGPLALMQFGILQHKVRVHHMVSEGDQHPGPFELAVALLTGG